MATALKIILRIILIVVLIAALAIGAAWGFVYFKYKVNLFSVVGTVNTLNQEVNVDELAPKQITTTDTTNMVTKVNNCFLGEDLINYNPSTEKYTINKNPTFAMTQDIVLTDKDVCCLANILIGMNDVSLNIGGSNVSLKDYDFKLLQIAFSDFDAEAKTMKFNVVSSISLTKLKDKMTSFPLSMFKSKVPETLYISSTVVLAKTSGAMSYTVEGSSIRLNNVENNKVEELCTLANNFVSIGTANELNTTIGTNFINAIIGTEESQGLTYSLVHATIPVASDFDLKKTGDEINYVIKKII